MTFGQSPVIQNDCETKVGKNQPDPLQRSAAYRVKSQLGVEFRRRAIDVLRRHAIDSYAGHDRRWQQLPQTVVLLERAYDSLVYLNFFACSQGSMMVITRL